MSDEKDGKKKSKSVGELALEIIKSAVGIGGETTKDPAAELVNKVREDSIFERTRKRREQEQGL